LEEGPVGGSQKIGDVFVVQFGGSPAQGPAEAGIDVEEGSLEVKEENAVGGGLEEGREGASAPQEPGLEGLSPGDVVEENQDEAVRPPVLGLKPQRALTVGTEPFGEVFLKRLPSGRTHRRGDGRPRRRAGKGRRRQGQAGLHRDR
jgi:hypothetical protein